MGYKAVLGMDIGGTHIRSGLVDNRYQLSHFSIENTDVVFNGTDPIEDLSKYILQYCKNKLGPEMPNAVSIGFPATIDIEKRIVCSTPNIDSLQHFQNLVVTDPMEDILKKPVYIDRDVNFLFLNDIEQNKLNENGIILGFYFGTGLGNTISIEGKILLGKNGTAGELGHVPILGIDQRCTCGNEGCMELFASGKYLSKLQSIKFSDTPIDKMFSLHRDEPELIEYVDYLSVPVATEINIFDPDYIIIGGGIVNMVDFPKEKLTKFIHKHTRKPYPERNLEILFSEPKQENGVIGAGIYAHRKMERK